MTDDPACSELAALKVGDADALVVTAVIAAEADFESMALALALALETIEPGAVRMPVGTDFGSTFVGATMMPPAAEGVAVEPELETETSVYSPVLRTV